MRLWVALLAAASLTLASFLPHGWTAVFPIAGTYLLFFFAFHPAFRLHRFGKFGDFSYGVYLYAFPIQQSVMHYIGHKTSPFRLFALAIG